MVFSIGLLAIEAIIGLLLILIHLRIKRIISKFEAEKKSAHEQCQQIKLHLKRHEDILSNFESDRLAPIASNLKQIHADQNDLLLYCTTLFADHNFGTNFQRKNRKHGAKS
ncbi:MAG TPA: hypothetical protein VFO10_06555 [Oligoflexus sp.]|uniref:hypothetical protein n=1 Tax=Oligoflexus sp. TaxID=1971216 RepID=UPI002D7EBE48|nr:hypothetical protein [Oligoflexus sp.]HET9236892.1 hypothetical protein [Oligoflexus sp.]